MYLDAMDQHLLACMIVESVSVEKAARRAKECLNEFLKRPDDRFLSTK